MMANSHSHDAVIALNLPVKHSQHTFWTYMFCTCRVVVNGSSCHLLRRGGIPCIPDLLCSSLSCSVTFMFGHGVGGYC